MEVVELKVRLHCKACEKAVRQSLCRIAGVKSVEIDLVLNKITVLGYMDRRVVVKAVQRTGRKAEVLSVSALSASAFYGGEEQSPRLPRGFRCIIIPRWGYSKSSKYNNKSSSVALSTSNEKPTTCVRMKW